MATSNFNLRHNARNFNAFMMNKDWEAYASENNLDVNDADENYSWQICEKEFILDDLHKSLKNKFDFVERNYGGIYDGDTAFTVESSFVFCHEEFSVNLEIVLEAGYYEGITFDFAFGRCRRENTGYYYDYFPDADDCREMLEYVTNPGMAKMLAGKLWKRIGEKVDEMGDRISDALDEICNHNLGVVARFDNGETWFA